MNANQFASACDIRSGFAAAMSDMYRREVPAYGTLIRLVEQVNEDVLTEDEPLRARLNTQGVLERLSAERHGAIRLGTAFELSTLRRIFAVLGMHPVGYYNLSNAGVPVHATAFRPITEPELARNPFRIFTSLLRLDLIADRSLRSQAQEILEGRRIFTRRALELLDKAERQGGLLHDEADAFVREVVATFRWHQQASVDAVLYARLSRAHRLIADIVSFKGPHINHLTPRTLDIDRVQALMNGSGLAPKDLIEGPPRRHCPILLRQTSFKALEEPVSFLGPGGTWQPGSHTARFGEIEQRGIALTPKGRALYDRLLDKAQNSAAPATAGSDSRSYEARLAAAFADFPDTWSALREQSLGYFKHAPTSSQRGLTDPRGTDLDALIARGHVRFDPITYEDFLPVSAAGIFQSNLGDDCRGEYPAEADQQRFEADLGGPVLSEFDLYAGMEKASIERCLSLLGMPAAIDRNLERRNST